MNLLYISNCSNNVDAGLNWSVPAGVNAQQEFDNVLWVDLTKGAYQEHWGLIKAYHNINEFGKKISLQILPKPFNNPDYVIFEGFYYMEQVLLSIELIKKEVPYIIIPRGSLTSEAFHNGGILKFIKKKLAHFLIFNSYIKHAKAVQYLTLSEKKESEKHFKANSFILPNGFLTPKKSKISFSNGIRAVFIGRQDIYQKGIDLLLNSLKDLHAELKNAGFYLDIYGPPRYDYKEVSLMIKNLGIDDLVHNNERGVSGDEKQNILLNSDVFFLTSRFEGHPMGLIESLSYGLPCFITRGANMYEEVIENNTGWACETSVESIKEHLLQMILDKEKFHEYGINSKILASKYDWNVLAEKLHNTLLLLKK